MSSRVLNMQINVDPAVPPDVLASAAIESTIQTLLENDVDAVEVMGALTLHLSYLIKLFTSPNTDEIH